MNSTAVVTAASTYQLLTTLDRVKAELGISGATYDDLLTAKIREATSDIFARTWPRPRETITETFWPPAGSSACCEALILSRHPIDSVTSVTIDDAALDPAEYRVAADAGMLHALSPDGYPTRWSIAKAAIVVYVAGFTMPGEISNYTLPQSLESACVDLVSSYWTSRGRDPTVRAESVPGVIDTTYWVGAIGEKGDLPPSVEAKIAPFSCGVFV